MVELAEKTITAPSASRQRVAVSSMLYSAETGRERVRLFAFPCFRPLAGLPTPRRPRATGKALTAAPRRSRGSARRGARSSRRRRNWRRRARAARPRRARPRRRRGGRRPRGPRSGAGGCRPRRRAPARRPGARRWRRSGRRRRSARGSGSSSGANGSPFSLPPRIRWTPLSKARIPTTAEATLVALESLTKRTPPISATCSSRCGTPAKLRRPSRTASRSSPIASAAAAAAIALWTLCSPNRPSSSTASSGSPS